MKPKVVRLIVALSVVVVVAAVLRASLIWLWTTTGSLASRSSRLRSPGIKASRPSAIGNF